MKNGRYAGTSTLESMGQAVWYNQWTLRKFKNYLKDEILDVGCGIGNFTHTLSKYGQVTAIDVNIDYIKNFQSDSGIKVGLGDIEKGKYFFSNKKFDTIVCLNVLEHIEDDRQALRNLYNLLKNEGHIILLVPAHDFLFGKIDESIGHFRRYDKNVLSKDLIKTGFRIIKSRTINILGALGWWISSRLLSGSTVGENEIKIFNLIAPLVLPLEDIYEPPVGTSILFILKKEK